MKIAVLHEVDIGRRGFLRVAASVVSGNPLKLLSGALGSGANKYVRAAETYTRLNDAQRDGAHRLLSELVSQSLGGKDSGLRDGRVNSNLGPSFVIGDGVVSTTSKSGEAVKFPLSAIVGYQLSFGDLSKREDIGDWLNFREIWDTIDPSLVDNLLTSLIKQSGIRDFVSRFVDDDLPSASAWSSLLKHPAINNYFGIDPETARRGLSWGHPDIFDPKALHLLVKKGLVKRDIAKDYMRWDSSERKNAEAERAEEEQRDSYDEIQPRPDDEFSASPMHQPVYAEGFYARLDAIFAS